MNFTTKLILHEKTCHDEMPVAEVYTHQQLKTAASYFAF